MVLSYVEGKGNVENNLEHHVQQLQRFEKGIKGARWCGFQYACTASIDMNNQPIVFNFGKILVMNTSVICLSYVVFSVLDVSSPLCLHALHPHLYLGSFFR